MSKEMNKLKEKITKYDIKIGLFMSLIIGLVFTFKLAIIYLLGVILAILNFRYGIKFAQKWMFSDRFMIFITAMIRIFILGSVVLMLGEDKLSFIIFYMLGLLSHYPVLIYCTFKEKGSA